MHCCEDVSAELIEKHCRAGIEAGLEQAGNEWAVAAQFINQSKQIGVERQAVKSQMISKLTVQNALRPIIVEMHISAHGEKERRNRKSCQDDDPKQKDDCKDVMAGPQKKRSRQFPRFHVRTVEHYACIISTESILNCR